MENDTLKEVVVGGGLLVLLVLLANPLDIFMPSPITMMLLTAIVILALLLASFVWKETAQDEREHVHRMLAGRAAFLAGAVVLLLGIAVQTFAHRLDLWLPAALGAMVAAKLAVRAYSRRNH